MILDSKGETFGQALWWEGKVKILQDVHLSQAAGIQTSGLLHLAKQKDMSLIKEIFQSAMKVKLTYIIAIMVIML